MTSFDDSFPGSSLNAEWTNPAGLDTPVVSGGSAKNPTLGSLGGFGMVTATAFPGNDLVASVVVDSGVDPLAFAQVGLINPTTFSSVSAVWFPDGSGLVLFAGSTTLGAASGALTGRYKLEVVASGGSATANLYEDGDPTPVLTVTSAIDSDGLAVLALPGRGFWSGGASDEQTYDDFHIENVESVNPPEPPKPTGMIFRITTLRYPEAEPEYVERLTQFEDGEVEIELDELRLARVTISMYDKACSNVKPLERFLHVRYLGEVVFWGPMLDPEWDYDNAKVTINAIDAAYRLSKAFVRIGDDLESSKEATVDSRGVRKFRDCGLNTAGQTARGVPDLGVGDGSNDVPNEDDITVTVDRGDNALQGLLDLVGSADNPMDIEFEPQEIGEGSYVKLNTYIRQGSDQTDNVVFHYNWGIDNVESFKATPSGSLVITHDHVLSQDLKYRGTAAASAPSARFGPYVKWDALDRDPAGGSEEEKEDQLRGIGKLRVEAYGEPPKLCVFTPRVTDGADKVPKYLVNFKVGDTVKVIAKRGFGLYNEAARVRKVTLKQESHVGYVRCEIQAAPTVGADGDIGEDE